MTRSDSRPRPPAAGWEPARRSAHRATVREHAQPEEQLVMSEAPAENWLRVRPERNTKGHQGQREIRAGQDKDAEPCQRQQVEGEPGREKQQHPQHDRQSPAQGIRPGRHTIEKCLQPGSAEHDAPARQACRTGKSSRRDAPRPHHPGTGQRRQAGQAGQGLPGRSGRSGGRGRNDQTL